MQLPEAPGEQAGIWSGGHVSFSSWGGWGGRVSLVHLRSDCPQHYGERGSPMGTPKVSFPLFLYPVGSSYKTAPSLVMPSLKEKHLFSSKYPNRSFPFYRDVPSLTMEQGLMGFRLWYPLSFAGSGDSGGDSY